MQETTGYLGIVLLHHAGIFRRAEDDAADKIEAVEANDIIYPIHQNQLGVKEGLYEQNPGY